MRSYLQDLSKLTIGILGGGQLGWMMILEGRKYPITFYVMDNPDAPACRVADKCFKPEKIREMVDSVDVVTYEFEHIYEKALNYASEKGKLLPELEAVKLKRERWREREFFKRIGLPVPGFYTAQSGEEALKIARNEFNYCAVIKQSRGGYDGKGQFFIKSMEEFEKVKDKIAKTEDVFVVEEFVDFDYEASIIAIRDLKAGFKAYPPTYNYNEKGILVYNYGPLDNEHVAKEMAKLAQKLCNALNYVGVMGIEFFVKNEKILVNEFAPRVHNTGHYTLDAAFVSQFEQHIRAILGLEVADAELLSHGGMVNILGIPNPPLDVLNYGKLYWYGKTEARKRRKMGHVNIVGDSLREVEEKRDNVMKTLYPNGLDL